MSHHHRTARRVHPGTFRWGVVLPWMALAVVVVVVGGGVVLSAVAGRPAVQSHDAEGKWAPRPDTAGTEPPDLRGRHAVRVLRRWDSRRSQAWAAGDPAALRRLYTAGSVAGRNDVAMLRHWSARGLRVEHLRTELLSVVVIRAGPRRLRLRTSDRVVSAAAVGADRSVPLPHDRADVHVIELRRAHGSWHVASVLAG